MNRTRNIKKMNDHSNIEKEQEIQKQIWNDFFKYATDEVVDQIAKEASNYEKDGFEPSNNFTKEMNKMITRESRKESFERNRTKFARIAVGIAITCVAASTFARNVEAFRVPIFNFFVEVQDKFSRVNLQKEGEEDQGYDLEHVYKEYPGIALPVEVPEGFKYMGTSGEEGNYWTDYENNEGRKLMIAQFKGIENVIIDTENEKSKITKYNSREYTIRQGGNKTSIVWQQGGNYFHISGNITKDEALRLADSMCFAQK